MQWLPLLFAAADTTPTGCAAASGLVGLFLRVDREAVHLGFGVPALEGGRYTTFFSRRCRGSRLPNAVTFSFMVRPWGQQNADTDI